ncbi:aldo/keto reductase [uncultured Treponema sp.]|uniref:aldo/keto reductase n=1 Tax=uncultured Treponema sp. TaxID=162155 RepID=UPI0015BD5743|nr:aldo/keto reductase [uncultured Treponema sp.]
MEDFKSLESVFSLSNGVKMPCLGFGTWQSSDGEEAYNAVLSALRLGYRHIDTAAAYGNEKSVGRAIADFLKESSVRRSDLFITTKLWNEDHGYENAKKAIEVSLEKLGLDYLDLYLIHWPNPLKFRSCWQKANAESWAAMEEAVDAGKIRAIGISNFCERHIDELLKTAKIKPMVNQIKVCPGQPQKQLADYSRSLGMVVEGYSPLGTGGIFKNAEIQQLAEKYGRTVAQVCIRWCLQQGVVPLPKSVNFARIKENSEIFDFMISEEDLEIIANLKNLEIRPVRNPDEADF